MPNLDSRTDADDTQRQCLCFRQPEGAQKMSFYFLLIVLLVIWLVQTGIISSDNAIIADVVLPLAKTGLMTHNNETD